MSGDIEVLTGPGVVRVHFHRGPLKRDLRFEMDVSLARDFSKLLASAATAASKQGGGEPRN